MKIKMKMGVNGTFHNIEAGVVLGQVVDIEDAEAERYIALGYAEAVKPGGKLSEEHAVAALSNEERAVLDKDIIGASSKAVPQSKVAQGRSDDPAPLVLEADEPKPEPKKPEPKAMTTADVPTPATKVAPRPRRPR